MRDTDTNTFTGPVLAVDLVLPHSEVGDGAIVVV